MNTQGLNFHEIKKKLESLQLKDSSNEDRLATYPEKKSHLHKQPTRDRDSKKRFETLKIDDFILYSTLGNFFENNRKINVFFG